MMSFKKTEIMQIAWSSNKDPAVPLGDEGAPRYLKLSTTFIIKVVDSFKYLGAYCQQL